MKSFEELARDLMKPGAAMLATMTPEQTDLLHAALGVTTEAGELGDAIKKHAIYQKPLAHENVVEELADLRFCMAAIMNNLGIGEMELYEQINRKLGRRYADGAYSDAQAQRRADKA